MMSFDFGFWVLDVIGNQARPLVGSGRAAIRVGRRRDNDEAAVRHGFELAAQQQRLLARLPGMRHALGGGFGVARHAVPAEIDAGRQHQAVVGKPRAARERHHAGMWIDFGGDIERRDDSLGCDLLVIELLGLEIAQAGNDLVAERAGSESLAGFDQRVTAVRGSSRLTARAQVAPAKPPPTTTTRPPAFCASAGIGISAVAADAAAAPATAVLRT